MKKIRNLILIALFILLPFQKIDAQEAEDMSKWSFKILLQHCDQNDAIKIVKFKNKESDRYGFCLEAEVDYNPKDNLYYKEPFDDEVLDEAIVFVNTSKQAARIRCATIGWNAASSILKDK